MAVQRNTQNMNELLQQLNNSFAIDDSVIIKKSEHSDLYYIEIKNNFASVTIQLQGAHLTNWTPNGSEQVIWLSDDAKFVLNKSIRGGIPICWPWFGAHQSNSDYPAHGFARTVIWEIELTETLNSGATQITLSLPTDSIPSEQWPFDTQLHCKFTLGQTLKIELITINNSDDDIIIGEALHTYFNVSNVRNTLLEGLDECEYLDKLNGFKNKLQTGNIEIKQEIDRIYTATNQNCVIEDLGFNRRIEISKDGSLSTIVWNPWIDTANKMGDLGEDGYLNMLCVESGNAAQDVVTIKPGGKHSLIARYTIEKIILISINNF